MFMSINIPISGSFKATKEEIDSEMVLFTKRLKACLEGYDLKDIPIITASKITMKLSAFGTRWMN